MDSPVPTGILNYTPTEGPTVTTATRFLLVAGTTGTATIDGLSGAGTTPVAMRETPSADAEVLWYGEPVRTTELPVSPSGCPTPALFTRAIRELVGFDVTVLDGGLAEPTAAPTVSVGAKPGREIRKSDPVPSGPGAFAAARQLGRQLPATELLLGETIPGGTTTALGVLRALGERGAVSSSLRENPVAHKREVVRKGLAASDLEPGGAAGEPKRAVRRMGDPVLATAAGTALGAIETDTAVTLAGGSQLLAVAALLRHAGVETSLDLVTTPFVLADDSADLAGLAADLDVSVSATDPGFPASGHGALAAYVDGEAKEGVGFGGALELADRAGIPMERVRERAVSLYEEVQGA